MKYAREIISPWLYNDNVWEACLMHLHMCRVERTRIRDGIAKTLCSEGS